MLERTFAEIAGAAGAGRRRRRAGAAAAPAADRRLHLGRAARRAVRRWAGCRRTTRSTCWRSSGVAVLLFVVGLKLDLKLVRHLGPVALATGLGQLLFTIVFGFLLGARRWAWTGVKALYVAVALTFSSTIIIVKLLSDKRELDSLHGRIAVGFLIVQDIAVVSR